MMVQLGSRDHRASRFGARQIYEALKEQILGRVYGTDGLLPSSRALAAELGVSRTTVTAAYEQLSAEGFIEIRHGARPRIAPAVINHDDARQPRKQSGPLRLSACGERLKHIPARQEQQTQNLVANFRYGDLASSDFPVLAWKRAVVSAIAHRSERLAYNDASGALRLRTALQGYLWRSRTLRCELDQILIVSGSQQALDLCARLLLDASDRFVMEDPGYLMARHVFSATGAAPVSIPVDEHGLKTDLLTGLNARLAYVTPSHQFPLGSVMPVARRHQLLSWAKQAEAYVVEDDYDSEYRYDMKPVPPLYALEGGANVIYVGTVSKTLSPTLRIGYMVVPHELRSIFVKLKQMTDRHTPVIEQEALATILESGAYERHVRRARRRNGERRHAMLSALRRNFGDRIAIGGAEAGLHCVVWFHDLPRAWDAALVEAARGKGLGIYPVSPLFAPEHSDRQPGALGLVMGYAAMTLRQIERGCDLLGEAVAQVCAAHVRKLDHQDRS